MLRILWWGDGGCTTGFGRVTHEICNRLGEQYDVHVLGLNFRGDLEAPFDTANYKIYTPTRWDDSDVYGLKRLPELIVKLQPHILVILNDIPIIAEGIAELDSHENLTLPAIVVYTPIDAANLPPEWGTIADRPEALITYTQFAKRELEKVCSRKDIEIAYHGIDHAGFERVTHENPAVVTTEWGEEVECYSKAELKQAFGLEDNFVILWADRNSTRKFTPGAFAAVKPFMDRHPEAILWMHCAENDSGGNLSTFTAKYGLDGRVYKTPNLNTFIGKTDAYMNVLYNMADVKISTSLGEGAGLTNMEAARVGTPVILPGFSANTEMLPGIFVDIDYLYTTPRGCDFAFPKISDYDGFLEHIYQDEWARTKLSETAEEHVRKFKWDDAVEVFQKSFVHALKAKWEKDNGMV